MRLPRESRANKLKDPFVEVLALVTGVPYYEFPGSLRAFALLVGGRCKGRSGVAEEEAFWRQLAHEHMAVRSWLASGKAFRAPDEWHPFIAKVWREHHVTEPPSPATFQHAVYPMDRATREFNDGFAAPGLGWLLAYCHGWPMTLPQIYAAAEALEVQLQSLPFVIWAMGVNVFTIPLAFNVADRDIQGRLRKLEKIANRPLEASDFSTRGVLLVNSLMELSWHPKLPLHLRWPSRRLPYFKDLEPYDVETFRR